MPRLLAPSLLALLALFSAAPALAQGTLPHASLAQQALERLGRDGAAPETLDLGAAFNESCLHVRVGLYEVYMTRESAKENLNSDHMARVIQALLETQKAWLEWLEPIGEHKQAAKDLKLLLKWAGTLRGGQLVIMANKDGHEIMEGLSARDSIKEARDRFAAFMGTGAALGLEREDKVEPIILAADRPEFLQLVSLAGWIYPEQQAIYWQAGVSNWTNCYVDSYKFIALQFAGGGGAGSWAVGLAMDANTDDGLAQQVTQLAANSLVDSYYGSRIPPSLAGALSVNLTIDVFGTCDTRVDGDLNSRRTEAFEMFVPGGNSEGGWLPGRAADSRWREHQGSDHFIQVLKASQKNGAEELGREKGKLRNFELENDRGNRRLTISGPFLGSSAEESKAPPMQYVGDYKEFLRSYRSCFVYWLRFQSVGKAKASNEAFARWLSLLANEEEMDLEESMQQIFETPLSDGELEDQVLEGAFLAWLRKAK